MNEKTPSIAILTGISGSGKSTLLEKLIYDLRSHHISVGGIYTKGYWLQNFRNQFDLVAIETNETIPLAFRQSPEEPFTFSKEGLLFGQKALSHILERDFRIVIVDEIGPLETRGEGWAPFLPPLLSLSSTRLIVTIRPRLIEWFTSTFQMQASLIIEANHPNAIETLREFCESSINR